MRTRSSRYGRRLASVAAIVWMGVIFALSSLPGSAVPGRFGSLGHFVLYAVLGVLYVLALPRTEPRWKVLVLAVTLASAYGITDEFHQHFVPGRMPDVLDWAVDTAGAASAVILVHLLSVRNRPGGAGRSRLVD